MQTASTVFRPAQPVLTPRPDNPYLMAVAQMRVSPTVRLHSLIGTGRRMLLAGQADGVVPVKSARHPGVESELLIPATHTGIQRDPRTLQELRRIFAVHSQTVQPPAPLVVTP